jgi:DNA-binding XRE family transcriptional regulator
MNRETKSPNRLRTVREEMMISKAELARRAGVSALTIDRVESGENCRVDTKRKIILALGLNLSEKEKVFSNEKKNQSGSRS